MNTRAIAAAATVLALGACGTKFTGPEEVKGLRVLAVLAEPPEIGAPGDDALVEGGWPPAAVTSLHAVVAHPDFATVSEDRALVLHLACTPTPGDRTGTVCAQMSALSEPSMLVEHLSTATACPAPGARHLGVEGAITIAGLEACDRAGCHSLAVASGPGESAAFVDFGPSDYQLPTRSDPPGSFLAGLAAGDTQRVLGTDVVVLSLAIEGDPADLTPSSAVTPDCASLLPEVLSWFAAQWSLRPHVGSLKWVHVRGPDMPAESPANQNPSVTGISFGGSDLAPMGATPTVVASGNEQPLLPHLAQDPAPPPHQTYQRYDTDGNYVDTRDEDWAYSWFTTAGDLKHSHTQSWDESEEFTPKNSGDGSPKTAILWVVVRDLRGGEAWTAAEIQAQ
jgi:hypothetical protein